MRLSCPKCGQQADVPALAPGQLVMCGNCQTPLAPPSRATPVSVRPPVFVPVPVKHNPFDFSDDEDNGEREERRRDRREERQERREERGDRRQERTIRGLERSGNMLGITAMALACTTGLLALSGLLFVKKLPFYSGLAAFFGFPAALAWLICGLIAVLRPGRSRLMAGIATGVSAFLLLLVLPAVWVLLLEPAK